jgi:hypothetical protein
MADFKSNKFLEQDSDVIDYNEIFTPILNPEVFTLHTPKDNITIRIEFENGNGFDVNTIVNSPISSIKEVIMDMHNFPIKKQRLIYKNFSGTNGISLKDDNYILDYNFLRDNDVTLHLFILD